MRFWSGTLAGRVWVRLVMMASLCCVRSLVGLVERMVFAVTGSWLAVERKARSVVSMMRAVNGQSHIRCLHLSVSVWFLILRQSRQRPCDGPVMWSRPGPIWWPSWMVR